MEKAVENKKEFRVQPLEMFGNRYIWPPGEALINMVLRYKESGRTQTELANDLCVSRGSLQDRLYRYGLTGDKSDPKKYDYDLNEILAEMEDTGISLRDYCDRHNYSEQQYKSICKAFNRRGITTRKNVSITKKKHIACELSEAAMNKYKAVCESKGVGPNENLRHYVERVIKTGEL